MYNVIIYMVAKSRKNTSKKHRAVRKKILKTRKHKGGNFLGNLLGSGDGKGEKPEPPADTSATVHYKEINNANNEVEREEEVPTADLSASETPEKGDNKPGEGDNKPGEGDNEPGEGDNKPGEGDNEPGEGTTEKKPEEEVEGGVFSKIFGEKGGKKKGRKGKKKTAKKKTKKTKRKTAKKKKGKK